MRDIKPSPPGPRRPPLPSLTGLKVFFVFKWNLHEFEWNITKARFFIGSLILGLNYFTFEFRFIFSLILGFNYFSFWFRFIFSLILGFNYFNFGYWPPPPPDGHPGQSFSTASPPSGHGYWPLPSWAPPARGQVPSWGMPPWMTPTSQP
jgi:hypothetical protein